ncbi:MAG: Bax inhibitor-1/YccA family protein [Parachlamydiaceae bacterium]|nr:Bax inhibitor-1/YccA family protein [Parachlamydiaceae bacterium]
MRTSNPALRDDTFTIQGASRFGDVMTMQGVVVKTALLLLLALLTAGWTWVQFYKNASNPSAVSPWMIGGALGGFALALVTAFKPAWSSITAPLYALFQGLFIGGLSAIMELSFPGIVMQATILTFGTLLAMLAAYQSGFIRATDGFKRGIIAATGGIAILYLASFALSFFGIQIPFIFGNGAIGIGFSIVVVIIAALNFVLDFDFIEQGARRGAPKYMEWYAGFALMVTLIWLYIEFLRLLSKLRSR